MTTLERDVEFVDAQLWEEIECIVTEKVASRWVSATGKSTLTKRKWPVLDGFYSLWD